VLLVDDDPFILRATSRDLTRRGLTIVVTDSPFGAAAMIRAHGPSVAVVDHRMPGLSGDVLARLLMSTYGPETLAVVFYSATEPESQGAFPWVSKGDGVDALYAVVRRELMSRGMEA
jgi:CheY-like chemotaxis protein